MKFDKAKLHPLIDLQCDYSKDVEALLNTKLFQSDQTNQNTDINHFLSKGTGDNWTDKAAKIFASWRESVSSVPQLSDIVFSALDKFNIDVEHPLVPAIMTACLLGEINHNNPYHDNNHFREVLCICLKLAVVNSDIHPDTSLDANDICLLIIAASIHDFAHNGKSNIIDGVHIPSSLEKRSIAKARPFFEALALASDTIDKIERLILSTDPSRGQGGHSPAGVTRDIYLAHSHDNVAILNVSKEYELLLNSSKLSLISMMLCEADIVMSSSLTYDFSKQMTRKIAQESSVLKPSANTLYGFMQVVCHGGFVVDASQLLFSKSFRSIMYQAKTDSENNILYTKPQSNGAKTCVIR